jgi:hypothetical protein
VQSQAHQETSGAGGLTNCWLPKDRRPIYERTGARVNLPPAFSRQGPFSVESSRQLIRPFDALHNEITREVNVKAPPRDGKTMLFDIWLPDCVLFNAGPFIGVFQEEGIAKYHCKTRTWPVLESVPEIAAMVPQDNTKAGIQEILLPHMPIVIIGPAISGLQSRGFRFTFGDESWQWPKGRLAELKARNGDFRKLGIDKSLFTSQGGFAVDIADRQNSDWHEQCESGRLNEWQVRCLQCGEYHLPLWSGTRKDRSRWGLVWDQYRDDRGMWLIDKCLPTVRYECPTCRKPTVDGSKTKSEWNRLGDYYVQNESGLWVLPTHFVAKETFHWNAIITYPWVVLLEEFLQARNVAASGDRSKTIVFFQKYMAEDHDPNKDEEFESLPCVEIEWERPPEKPFELEGVLFTDRIGAQDVQQSHFELVFKAFSKRGDEVVLWAGKSYTWQESDELRAKFFVPHGNMGSDCQHRRSEVIENCSRLGSAVDGKWKCWLALEGTDVRSFPYTYTAGKRKGQKIELPYSWPPNDGDPTVGLTHDDPRRKEFIGKRCQIIRWSNPWMKDITAARRDGKAKGVIITQVRGDWKADYDRQMFSERKEQITRGTLGRTKFEWVRIGSRPNHKWDCSNMINVIAKMRGVLGGESETPEEK